MVATQLTIYNGALMNVGETALASLTEARESRYLLDNVYNSGEGFDDCLSEAYWKWSLRGVQWTADTSVTPAFGYRFAFTEPTDYLKTYGIFQDELFTNPLYDYRVEGRGYTYANIQIIYNVYVSNDINYGRNLANWTPNFNRFVELYFAWRIAPKVFQGDVKKMAVLEKRLHDVRTDAKSLDAMEGPTEPTAPGTWVRSRRARFSGWDRGSLNRLIG